MSKSHSFSQLVWYPPYYSQLVCVKLLHHLQCSCVTKGQTAHIKIKLPISTNMWILKISHHCSRGVLLHQ